MVKLVEETEESAKEKNAQKLSEELKSYFDWKENNIFPLPKGRGI